MVTDPHSTATLSLSDTTNAVVASRRYDPFGNARGSSTGTWPDSRGFLNAPADASTHLTHMGARDYDPVIGRFISVDPELDLSDPTQWNAYGYANGNPTTLSDPTGRRPEGAGDYGCSNCMMTASGSWKFGNETSGSKSVHGGTYHQSYAAAQEEQTTKAHKREEDHRANTADNTLVHQQQAARQAAAQAAATARARAANRLQATMAAAHASGGGHWYDPTSWDAGTWTQVGLGAATAVLTVVNAAQAGADPVTDGLEIAVIAEMGGEAGAEVAAETTTDIAAESASEGVVDIPIAGRSAEEVGSIQDYARATNGWLSENGPVTIRSTQGSLRAEANAASRAERLRAARAGNPYSGQAGHVPDTAISGSAEPPLGWMDMPGASNSIAGGVLGSRVGTVLSSFTVGGLVP